MGEAIKMAAKTRIITSLDNKYSILIVVAPSTFRIPISLVRCSAVKETSPNNPRQEMKIAR